MYTKITKFTKTALLSTLFVLPLFTAACGQPEEEGAENIPEDAIATTQSALCTDNGVPSYSAPLLLGDVGGTVSATSPASYGSALCTGRFVVEATGTAGKPNMTASATDAGAGLSQASCSSGSVSMLVYGFNGSSWIQLGGERTAAGVWTPSPFGGPSSCQIGIGISVPSTYQKVRVAAKASLKTVFGPASRKVTATIFSHY